MLIYACAPAVEQERRPAKRPKRSHDAPDASGSGLAAARAAGRVNGWGNARTLSDLRRLLGRTRRGSDKDSGDDDWEVMIGRHYPITLPPVATRVVGTYL